MVDRALIVGADGYIGRHLLDFQKAIGINAVGTSRRKTSNNVRFRLGSDDAIGLPLSDVDYCVICAGKTRFSECESDPNGTAAVNVDASLKLVRTLAKRGVFTAFLSSNAVFDGRSEYPQEDAEPCPETEYGRQKLRCEQFILEDAFCRESTAIIRLTKCVSSTMPLIEQALDTQAPPINAFIDVGLSPISLGFVAEGITKVCRSKKVGIFHLSGAEELSYFDFFARLLQAQGRRPNLRVRARSLRPFGADVNRLHSTLGMARTTRELCVQPQSLTALMENIWSPCDAVERRGSLNVTSIRN